MLGDVSHYLKSWGAGCLTWCVPVWDIPAEVRNQSSRITIQPGFLIYQVENCSDLAWQERFFLPGTTENPDGFSSWGLGSDTPEISDAGWVNPSEKLLKWNPRPQLMWWPWVNFCMLHSPLMMLYLFSVITLRAFMDDNVLHRRGMTTLWQCLFAGRLALEHRQRNNNKDSLLSYPSLTSSLIIFPSSVTHPDIHLHLCVNHCRYWRVEGVTPCLWQRWNLK